MHLLERLLQLSSLKKIALRNELGGEISYAGLVGAVRSVAEGLRGFKGESIAVLCRDPIQMAVGIYSAWLSKKAAVPLHYSYPEAEIEHRMRVSKSDLILCDDLGYDLGGSIGNRNVVRISNLLGNHVELGGIGGIKNDFDEEAGALVLFTSGTTGKPKGVLHTFSTLSAQMRDLHSAWGISDRDEFFLTLPLNHIHGLVTGMFNGLSAGAGLTVHSRFDVDLAWERLLDRRTTFFTAVPSIYTKLLRSGAAPGRLDHVRMMVSGSSPLSESLMTKWCESVRTAGIVERYGMTETGMICTNEIGSIKPGFVGRPFPSIELKIVHETPDTCKKDTCDTNTFKKDTFDTNTCKKDTFDTDTCKKDTFDTINHVISDNINAFGRVLVRGPGLFKGYLNERGELMGRRSEDFFETGDCGFQDSTGSLKLTGRDRDILKVSGYKVGAGEVESVVMSFAGVKECVVIGLDDPREPGNQIVAALVILEDYEDNLQNAEFLNRLRAFLVTKLAHYKVPRKWVLKRGESIPCNLIGKPDHEKIRQLFKH